MSDSLADILEGYGYRLGKLLGRGAFGSVYVATESSSNVTCALKFLPRANAQVERLTTEIGVLSSMSHPHIVKMHRVLLLPTEVVVVMDRAWGGDLMHLLEREGGALPEAWASRLIKQVTRALRYAHSTKVIHRDLKLENILLRHVSGEHAIVADFGLSQLQSNSTQEQRLCRSGSLYYMAPELHTGNARDGVAADVWALGVITYSLLVGRLPFFSATVASHLESAAQAEGIDLSSLVRIGGGGGGGGGVQGPTPVRQQVGGEDGDGVSPVPPPPSVTTSLPPPSTTTVGEGSSSSSSSSSSSFSPPPPSPLDPPPTWWSLYRASESALATNSTAVSAISREVISAASGGGASLWFPDHVSNEARKFVVSLLDPTPSLRPTMGAVLLHGWLNPMAQVVMEEGGTPMGGGGEGERERERERERGGVGGGADSPVYRGASKMDGGRFSFPGGAGERSSLPPTSPTPPSEKGEAFDSIRLDTLSIASEGGGGGVEGVTVSVPTPSSFAKGGGGALPGPSTFQGPQGSPTGGGGGGATGSVPLSPSFSKDFTISFSPPSQQQQHQQFPPSSLTQSPPSLPSSGGDSGGGGSVGSAFSPLKPLDSGNGGGGNEANPLSPLHLRPPLRKPSSSFSTTTSEASSPTVTSSSNGSNSSTTFGFTSPLPPLSSSSSSSSTSTSNNPATDPASLLGNARARTGSVTTTTSGSAALGLSNDLSSSLNARVRTSSVASGTGGGGVPSQSTFSSLISGASPRVGPPTPLLTSSRFTVPSTTPFVLGEVSQGQGGESVGQDATTGATPGS